MDASNYPKFHRDAFCYNKERDFFDVQIRLNGKAFRINISASDFHNSPSRICEFYEHLNFLRSGTDEDEDEDEDDGGSDKIYDWFDWAVLPCLGEFERLAPRRANITNPTLRDFLPSESFKCELGASDDQLILRRIERYDDAMDSDSTPPPNSDDEEESTQWSTTFPSFDPSQITVIFDEMDDEEEPLDRTPGKVSIDGRIFYFKAVDPPDDSAGQQEATQLEQIDKANLGPEVRTSRLHGVVQDEKRQLLGLLLDFIDMSGTLKYSVNPDTPQSSKERWTEQIKVTLTALHQAGIVWGDAKASNIIIDVQGDAWVIDFGGGFTSGWVDRNHAGTVDGDLQGLGNILRFTSTGEPEAIAD